MMTGHTQGASLSGARRNYGAMIGVQVRPPTNGLHDCLIRRHTLGAVRHDDLRT